MWEGQCKLDIASVHFPRFDARGVNLKKRKPKHVLFLVLSAKFGNWKQLTAQNVFKK